MKTLIIGGGLSGLALAVKLQAVNGDFLLVEAADRLGGRILSEQLEGAAFDLGPAWFWPQQPPYGQPLMAQLVADLRLDVFEQFGRGALRYQLADGRIQQQGEADTDAGMMAGSMRVAGGLGALIHGLQRQLPDGRIRLGAKVTTLEQTDAGITATLQDGAVLNADRVVLALPPRLAAESVTFVPRLPDEPMNVMRGISTWMAGQAKILAVYDQPYWRHAGCSGDAMSQVGPMVEIHDASPNAETGPFALFGFVGVPAGVRQAHVDDIRRLAVQQLVQLFGAEMANPLAVRFQDWAQDPLIATPLDQTPPAGHPAYGMPSALQGLMNGALLFGSTEVATRSGGYLEGALQAAEDVFVRMVSS